MLPGRYRRSTHSFLSSHYVFDLSYGLVTPSPSLPSAFPLFRQSPWSGLFDYCYRLYTAIGRCSLVIRTPFGCRFQLLCLSTPPLALLLSFLVFSVVYSVYSDSPPRLGSPFSLSPSPSPLLFPSLSCIIPSIRVSGSDPIRFIPQFFEIITQPGSTRFHVGLPSILPFFHPSVYTALHT